MKNRKPLHFLLGIVLLSLLVTLGWLVWSQFNPSIFFYGPRALNDVSVQVGFGARVPDSIAHANTIKYILAELQKAEWNGTLLTQEINGHIATNIMATRSDSKPVILLGAHYDSRIYADNDPNPAHRTLPVPGANDGASGVAVLLELARTLPTSSPPTALLFIDIEDNGNIPGWEWILGSRAFTSNMSSQPDVVIIIDMVGDSNLNIYMEENSDPEITNQIWKSAKSLGYESTFILKNKYRVLDDHIPFVEKGIRSVDIIDLDYPYWHTTQDTLDKVSAESLQIVGNTLLAWIRDYGK